VLTATNTMIAELAQDWSTPRGQKLIRSCSPTCCRRSAAEDPTRVGGLPSGRRRHVRVHIHR
jgi:hypothetical protein